MSNKKNDKKKPVVGFQESIEKAAMANINLSKDQIKEGLRRDITGIFLVISDLLRTEESLDALSDVWYKRYQDLKEASEKDAELTQQL